MVPAAGQTTLVVEVWKGEREVEKIVAMIDDERTRLDSQYERVFARRIRGDCYVSVEAFAQIGGASLTIMGTITSPDGSELLKRKLNQRLADELPRMCGKRVLLPCATLEGGL